MSTSKRNKIKGMFTRDQKENINTQDGKRNLYFDRERENYIKFGLVVGTTCSFILKNYKGDIINKLKEINGNDKEVNLNNYSFFIVELIANKYERKQALIDLKISMEDSSLFNIMQNRQLILCFLPEEKLDISIRKRYRDIVEMPNIQDNLIKEAEVNNVKNKDKKEIITYLDKTTIHYYSEKQSFSKEKIKVTEKEITIYYGKEIINTPIKDIKSKKLITDNEEKEIQKFFKDYVINGEKPKYCIEIITGNGKKLLIGRNTYQHFVTLVKAIDLACVHFKNYFVNNFINMELTNETNGIIYTNNFISQSCFTINDLLINKEKRKYLLEDFSETNIGDIVNNIIEYKSYFKKKKYSKAISKIKNILEIINEKMAKEERDKYEKILLNEKIEKLVEIYNKIKEIWNENEDILIDRNEDKVKELKTIIDIDLLDKLLLEIKDEYLIKHYDKIKQEEKFNNKLKLLLAKYFLNIYKIDSEQDFNYLGNENDDNIAYNLTYQLNQKRLKKNDLLDRFHLFINK